jgi:low affinity Fe/Cu permease
LLNNRNPTGASSIKSVSSDYPYDIRRASEKGFKILSHNLKIQNPLFEFMDGSFLELDRFKRTNNINTNINININIIMVFVLQGRLYPSCFVDEQVFSLHTACDEILRNCFNTERDFDDDDDDERCTEHDSITSTETRKTTNSVSPPKNKTKLRQLRRTHIIAEDDGDDHDEDDDSGTLIFKAENLAELQYLTNQSAQRIQREFEKRSDKCAHLHQRHLHERYGNRANMARYVDVNREHALAFQ